MLLFGAARLSERPYTSRQAAAKHVLHHSFSLVFSHLVKAIVRGSSKMVWSRKLPRPIYLNDGRTIGTLSAARDLLLALPQGRRASEQWQFAAELLLEAAYRGRNDQVRDAGTQMSRALEAEGLI
jgi:hypothetical protein